ncbi:MAG: Lrp/AsnC ligand binding domain-containing protein [Nitrosopumilus sp.]|nr:Lrp/AsnC ligand binding domain-containing protein [Nitrosopumilus sp.]
MQKSHVLISCQIGTETFVSSQIKKMKGIKRIERITGDYDLIVELESNSEEQLKKIVGNRIKNIDRIRSILMLVHAEPNNILETQ